MTIGIDIRVLQNDNKYRGIGEVARQVLRGMLPKVVLQSDSVIFYMYDNQEKLTDILDIPEGLDYSEHRQGQDIVHATRSKGQKIKDAFMGMYGQPISETSMCDSFIQFDYTLGVPTNTKTYLVKHDIIPYVFWEKYFASPWVHFRNKAARTTLRTIYHNYAYKHVLRRSLRNASHIICVSNHTKDDLRRHFGVSTKKMSVVHLGVSQEDIIEVSDSTIDMPTKPYLLFIGAADPRRAVDDLVSAYNNLKAAGRDIQLVLVGENFKSDAYIKKILPQYLSDEILNSSYAKDILKLGYISDVDKRKLYRNALAFVFPTHYEGFGIPILEAMANDCPVITYKNSSITEVANGKALYADDWEDIWHHTEALLDMPEKSRLELITKARKNAAKFTWKKTADAISALVLK